VRYPRLLDKHIPVVNALDIFGEFGRNIGVIPFFSKPLPPQYKSLKDVIIKDVRRQGRTRVQG